MFVGIGLAALAACFFGASFLGKGGQNGAAFFLWAWLAISIANGAYGVFRAGISPLNEIGAFVAIFGIPGLIAWYLAYRYGAAR
jgi:hypothetical protein